MAEAKTIDAKTFFEIGVPAALEAHKELAKKTPNTIQFDILGEGGGKWTVDFGKLQSKAGSAANPDLYIEMNAHDFSDLMTGKLSGELAASSGRLRAKGNTTLLRVFGGMLVGAKSK